MKSILHRYRKDIYLATISIIAFSLAGCAIVGPGAIRSGRLAYNEAINYTDN